MRFSTMVSLVLAFGCSKKSNEPPPPKPANGAPVAFVGSNFKPGPGHHGSIDVKAYNFSDKAVASYGVAIQYRDAKGAVLKPNPEMPEFDFEPEGFSGSSYQCEPTSWCNFTLKSLSVPEGTASVDIVTENVKAVASDGVHFDPLFDAKGEPFAKAK